MKGKNLDKYQYTGKEKKVCKQCAEINPFFKNECVKCNYKFPKTRALHGQFNSDCYAMYFWEMLHSDTLFASLSKINDFLEDKEFCCIQLLYKKVKEVLSRDNTERFFDISDMQLLELHDFIDETFEMLLTDNETTTKVFDSAALIKSNKRTMTQ